MNRLILSTTRFSAPRLSAQIGLEVRLVHGRNWTLVVLVLAVLTLTSQLSTHGSQAATSNSSVSGRPLLIREGPIGPTSAASGGPYWFQQGGISDSTTNYSVGAKATIRTVYDNVNNDAHSYWVGSFLTNGAFVQVGYLNTLTTSNQFYCCAWFYESFPSGNDNSPPIIGPPGSAGPIGSWHTYSMNYNASFGVWSFYMDNLYLGSTPSAGQTYYIGSGSGIANTGTHSVAALSEVAQTYDTNDIIGPAEFANFQYETTINSWKMVPIGKAHIGYGDTPPSNVPPNPYSVAEISGLPNDFLTGSNIANPGSDQCGNQAANGADLWATTLTCIGGNSESFSFVTVDGSSITPTWISLNDSGGRQIYYTDNQNYNGLSVPNPSGQWTVDYVSWHGVNVATSQIVNMSMPRQVFLSEVFSITLAVVGYIYSLPVNNATVILYLPDSTNQTVITNSNGEGVFTLLPPSSYSIHIKVPYGIASNQVQTLTGPGSVVAKVFSLPELITIIVPPIFIAVLASILIVRKEQKRQALIRAQTPTQPMIGPSYCMSCGQPLSPGHNFCTSCGTPVRMIVP